jgi:pilus assembly protein Flp/PilA
MWSQENSMSKIFARFRKDESGATAIEYGLIAALISVALIAGATTLGGALNNQFTNLSTKLNNAGK